MGAEFVRGRLCKGPSLSGAEFVRGRDVPESFHLICTFEYTFNFYMEKMILIILKYLVVTNRKDNKIDCFQVFGFWFYIVSYVTKSNKFTSPNNKPNHRIPSTFDITSIFL